MKEIQHQCKADLQAFNCCVIMPTYNNQKTVGRVIESILRYTHNLIVVNDGATDNTPQIIESFQNKISIVSYAKNKGKGYALKQGFKEALQQGFKYAITIDSDGQHFAEDIPLFVDALQKNKGALIMGARNITKEGMPQKNTFANKFSNFWVKVQTGLSLPDTQTGFRLYPLRAVEKLKLWSTKFELEVEVLVKLAWQNVPIIPIDIQVKYDPNERVSHFRPLPDFTRISILNTYLTLLTILWYFHKRQLLKLWNAGIWEKIKAEAIKPQESNFSKAFSVGFGLFIGIMPLLGFQLLIGIPLAILLRLNKVLVVVAAHISIPPMIPIIVYISYKLGAFFVSKSISFTTWKAIALESIHLNFMQYFIGGWVFALLAALFGFLLSFVLLNFFRKKI